MGINIICYVILICNKRANYINFYVLDFIANEAVNQRILTFFEINLVN